MEESKDQNKREERLRQVTTLMLLSVLPVQERAREYSRLHL